MGRPSPADHAEKSLAVVTQIASGRHEIELGALSPTRDFNFIQDTVDGMIAVLESEASLGEVVNLGSGFEISIGDLVRVIARCDESSAV